MTDLERLLELVEKVVQAEHEGCRIGHSLASELAAVAVDLADGSGKHYRLPELREYLLPIEL